MKQFLNVPFVLLLFLFSNGLVSQDISDDFEGGGTITSWVGDDCTVDEPIANPYKQGINTSANVLRYKDEGGDYANVRFDLSSNLNLSNRAEFTLKIYVESSSISGSQPNQISMKLQDGKLASPWSTQCEIIKPLELDKWQIVSFNFISDTYINLDPNSEDPTNRSDFNRVLIQINGENNKDLVTVYVDDFVYEKSTGGNPSNGFPVYNKLIWADEFNGQGAIDTSKWFHQTKLPDGNSWYNGEIQHYTNRIENTYQSLGNLNLVAKKEQFTDQGVTKSHTSARLNSKIAFTYGRVEARAKLPTGVGTWPAIWMLGKNIDEPGGYYQSQFGNTAWPACGEIDIMEHWGSNQNYVQSAMHTPSSFGGTINKGGKVVPDASTAFHVYSVDWYEDRMVFSVDSIEMYVYKPSVRDDKTWPFTEDQYVLLNIAIEPSITSSFSQSSMIIDYVRIYQANTDTSGSTGVNESIKPLENQMNMKLFPNPSEDDLVVSLSRPVDAARWSIVDISTGQEVMHGEMEAIETHIDVSALRAQVYAFTLVDSAYKSTQRFLKR